MRKNKLIALSLTFGLGLALTFNSNTKAVYSEYNSDTNITDTKTSRSVGRTLNELIPDATLANNLAKSISALNSFSTEEKLNQPLTLAMIEGLKSFSYNGVKDYTGLDTFYNLETLTISTDLEVLPDFFNNFRKLQTVNITGVKDLTLPESFGNLSTLTTLSIVRCENLTLPDSFTNLSSLTSLTMQASDFTAVPENIGNLTALTSFKFYYNRVDINTLPESLYTLNNLTTLEIVDSGLTNISDNLTNLTSLQSLNLTDNSEIGRLPENIGSLTNLTSLKASNTGLTTLPNSIYNLTSLTYLDLSKNQLDSVSENIGNFSQLGNLALNNNKISIIPDSIESFERITTLNLADNMITSLPSSFGNITSLRFLYLENNQLETLPDSFTNLVNLRFLFLSSNKLSTLPENINNLTNLERLVLSKNEFSEVPANITKMTNLAGLYFDSNKLTSLPENISDLSTTGEFAFNDNLITSLPEEMGKFRHIILFNLNDNQITNIPASLLNSTGSYNSGFSPLLENNLLAPDVYKTLADAGLQHYMSTTEDANMKKLSVRENQAPIDLKSAADFSNLDLYSIVAVKKTTFIYGEQSLTDPFAPLPIIGAEYSYADVLPDNILEIGELVDETGNPVVIDEYFANGEVIKGAKLFANVSIIQKDGLLTEVNPNLTTTVAFTITKEAEPVVEPEVVNPPTVEKKDEVVVNNNNKVTVNNPDVVSNAITEKTETDATTVAKVALPTTGNDTNIIALTSVLVLSLSYVLTRKKFN